MTFDYNYRSPLLLCSKSPWTPPIRREHAWAMTAAERGHAVTFVERPRDVRALGDEPVRVYASGLAGPDRELRSVGGVRVQSRATIVPGHRNPLAARLNAELLQRVIRKRSTHETAIVCSWPWDWPAARRSPGRRRIFDMADDWGEIMPGRADWFRDYYRQIADEADEIIIVNPDLERHFPGRSPVVVRNGVFESLLAESDAVSEPATMVYVGTLTHRFDAELMASVLRALPGWRLDIVGGCLYPGLGDRPAPELLQLLNAHPERTSWHGQLERQATLPLLDKATVAIVPNRPSLALGQDSMKFYDYAARGRPIVSTRWFDPRQLDHPPHTWLADTADEFASGVVSAARGPSAQAETQRDWAAAHTWSQRWDQWSTAVFGLPEIS